MYLYFDYSQGIDVFNEDNELVGKSKTAGLAAVSQVRRKNGLIVFLNIIRENAHSWIYLDFCDMLIGRFIACLDQRTYISCSTINYG